jgi:hypothetical protein
MTHRGKSDPVFVRIEVVKAAIAWQDALFSSALRSLHSDVLREPLPDRIAELLRQLDERLRQLDQDDDKA